LEVNNTANNDVILGNVLGQLVVACPHTSENDLSRCLLHWEATFIVAKCDFLVDHSLALDVCPDTEQEIFCLVKNHQFVFLSRIAFATGLCFFCSFFDFLLA